MLPVVLLAGGRGTRIAAIDPRLPKPMLPVLGRPFLDWKLAGLAAEGAGEIILLVAHRGDEILAHLPALRRTGLTIVVIEEEPEPLGTGGALRAAMDRLPSAFLLGYADSYLTVPHTELETFFRGCSALAALAVVSHDTPEQPGNTDIRDGRVFRYEKARAHGRLPFLDYGQMAMKREAVGLLPEGFVGDLGVLVNLLAAQGELAALILDGEFFDLNTPESLSATERAFVKLGLEDRLGGYLP